MALENQVVALRARLSSAYAAIVSSRDVAFAEWIREPRKVDRDPVSLVRSLVRPPLFDYQSELVQVVCHDISCGRAGLLSLPTGGGKTRTGVSALLEAFTLLGMKHAVWLAPTMELVDQARATLVDIWKQHGSAPDMVVTYEYPASLERAVWVTTPQKVYARVKSGKSLSSWDAVVFDEAHQLEARTFGAAVDALITSPSPVFGAIPAVIGMSATPGRSNPQETESLVSRFGGRLLTSEHLGANPVRMLQRRGVLSRLNFRELTARQIAPDNEVDRIDVAARACRELVGRGRHVLVFTSSVAGAIVLAEILASHEVPSVAVYSGMPPDDRDAAIDSFARHETHVLVNQRLLATGYDCPAVSDVVLVARIGSAILFEQMVGRAARGPRTGGGAQANIWQFDDHLSIHGLPTSYYRYRDYDWSNVR